MPIAPFRPPAVVAATRRHDRKDPMRATLIYGAGDVRVEQVPDPVLREPTDALVRVVRSCICGSDLWPYGSRAATGHSDRIGHEFLGLVEDVGAEVSGLERGDWWWRGSCGPTTPVT